MDVSNYDREVFSMKPPASCKYLKVCSQKQTISKMFVRKIVVSTTKKFEYNFFRF